jgi:hypothetical protein
MMMNICQKTIITALLSVGGFFSSSEVARADQPIRKTREKAVVFSEVIPSEGDIIRIDHDFRVRNKGNEKSAPTNKPKRVYVVKIYAEFPKTSKAIDLYVGEMLVGEYRSCKGGVFFKIYGDDALKRHYGKPIRFVFDGMKYDLGISFPTEKDTIASKQNSQQTKTLLTLKEFLGDTASSEGDVDEK